MALNISTNAIREKNKTASDGVFLLLLEIYNDAISQPIRIVWNNENIVWNGHTYFCYPFELGDLNESNKNELPNVSLTVVDIERLLLNELDAFGGGVGSKVFVKIINTNLIAETEPLLSYEFDILSVSVTSDYKITFTLGTENLENYRSPSDRFIKLHCRYRTFKGLECGYSGTETSCNRTYTRCKALGNQQRFGGFLGIQNSGIYQ
jgi:phage-related protein